MAFNKNFVTYEDFGAVGDGVSDDLPAICEAHAYANSHGLPVRSKPDATYHLGHRALTAIITTDTDWNTSRFTIDDSGVNGEVEDHKRALFEVRSLLAPENVQLSQLTRDQRQVAARPARDCHILVENEQKRLYIRRGLNQNNGDPQHDCFILRQDGSIEGDIDWNYEAITRIEARPIDEKPIVLSGGVFTTLANRMAQPVGYNYWHRNIEITRSNTTVDGLTHYVVGETSVGHPYRGFLSANQCANVTLRNCFATPHKIYSTIGAAGKPVNMGSYDLHANNVVNLHLASCRINLICDRTRWGVIATNFCKNILLEDCTFSRMDTHMGVSGEYTVRGCTFGHMGLNAIGRGRLTIENCIVYGRHLVNFRQDYGSTWEGDLVIRNSHWVPACGDEIRPHLIGVSNDGTHDFGYPCFMPQTVNIIGLTVEDNNTPDDYDGLYLFTDPDAISDGVRTDTTDLPSKERAYPYARTRSVKIQGLTTVSGKTWRVSPNAEIERAVTVNHG